jgi:hypothetical protein
MLDPLNIYSRLLSAGLGMISTAQRVSETTSAAGHVIAKRTEMMGAAARSPFEGNYAELSRMVPEKIAAFSDAGVAMAGACWGIGLACMAEARNLHAMAAKGRAPTFAEWMAISSRNANFTVQMVERAGEAAENILRPIHAAATANAARLRRANP